jgi:cytosine permease
MMHVVQMIFGFFAMAGASGADWGAATTNDRDVRVGGWVAVGFAPVVVATIAFVAIAGYQGRLAAPVESEFSAFDASQGRPDAPTGRKQLTIPISSTSQITMIGRPAEATFRTVITDGIGGRLGCAMLMIVGVAALAPAVYSAYVFGQRLNDSLPRLSKTRWTLVGAFAAWPMVAFGIVARLEVVFSVMGALFAPMVACIAAEYALHRGVWPGPRLGVNRPGLLGWLVGLLVGLIPLLGGRVASFQQAAFWAFLAGYAIYWIAAKVVGESSIEPSIIPIEMADSAT